MSDVTRDLLRTTKMNFTEYIAVTLLAVILGALVLQGAIVKPLEAVINQTAEAVRESS